MLNVPLMGLQFLNTWRIILIYLTGSEIKYIPSLPVK